MVITGMGAITPLGHNVTTTWQNMVEGHSTIDYITHFDSSPLPVHIAAEVKDFSPNYMDTNQRSSQNVASHPFCGGGCNAGCRKLQFTHPLFR